MPAKKLDRDRDRTGEPRRAEFGQEHGDAHRQRKRHGEREEGRHKRADDRTSRPEHLGDGVPFGGGQEAEAERLERRPAADGKRHDKAGQRRHQQGRCAEAGSAEQIFVPACRAAGGAAPLAQARAARALRTCGHRLLRLFQMSGPPVVRGPSVEQARLPNLPLGPDYDSCVTLSPRTIRGENKLTSLARRADRRP